MTERKRRDPSFQSLFRMARIRQGSRSWRDYEVGKAFLKYLPPGDYEKAVNKLAKHICL